jgi:hypothetical protein
VSWEGVGGLESSVGVGGSGRSSIGGVTGSGRSSVVSSVSSSLGRMKGKSDWSSSSNKSSLSFNSKISSSILLGGNSGSS